MAVLVLAAAALWAPPAGAATRTAAVMPLRSDAHLARVLSPRRGAIVRGRRVTVRVRVERGARLVSARLGHRRIAGRFRRRRHGRMLVARLRLGRARAPRRGDNRLVVMVRKGRHGDAEVVPFALVRRDPRLLRIAAPRRTARAVRLKLRLRRADARVTVWLNGHAVRLPSSANEQGRVRGIRLSADEGLRHGRNVLRVKALDRRSGRVTVRRRVVTVERTAPIAGAGTAQRVSLGRGVRLDASATEAARAPKSLRYHWRIVRRPRGSRAKLHGANRPRPHFKPDLPGRYRLRMVASERMPPPSRFQGRGRAASIAMAADTTTIAATPFGAGIGVALETLDEGSGGIGVKVGAQRYLPPEATDTLQLVVLDRRTLELVSNNSFPGSAAGTAKLAAAVSKLGRETIAIIATPSLGAYAPVEGNAALANLNRAVAAIGGRAIPAAVAEAADYCDSGIGTCASFSVVGTPGFGPGEGVANPGLSALDGPGGDLSGYL